MVKAAWLRRGLVLAALLGATGCSTTLVSLNEGPREYVATDYENVLRAWTRTEHLFALSELDNFLTATATFEAWDFRWAYVARYAQDYRLTIEQRQKLLEKTLEETRQHHQFFVAIFGGERKYNDITKPNSATWRHLRAFMSFLLIPTRGNCVHDIRSCVAPSPACEMMRL